jgi:hypothetical protein
MQEIEQKKPRVIPSRLAFLAKLFSMQRVSSQQGRSLAALLANVKVVSI